MKSNKEFIKDLIDGYSHQLFAAGMLAEKGWNVELPALRIRGSFKNRSEYSDDYDIKISIDNHDPIRIEVKSRSIRFTSPEDYPFSTAFISTTEDWKNKEESGWVPSYFLLFSQATKGIVVVDCRDRKDWLVEKMRTRYGPMEFWSVPREKLLSFDVFHSSNHSSM